MASLKFVFGLPFSLRQRRLAMARPSISKQDFVDRSASSELGKAAASILWDKLIELRVVDELTPYPDDDLLHTYGLADEDLDEDIILDILKSLNRTVPSENVVRTVGPINSPLDIVRLVESRPQAE